MLDNILYVADKEMCVKYYYSLFYRLSYNYVL